MDLQSGVTIGPGSWVASYVVVGLFSMLYVLMGKEKSVIIEMDEASLCNAKLAFCEIVCLYYVMYYTIQKKNFVSTNL